MSRSSHEETPVPETEAEAGDPSERLQALVGAAIEVLEILGADNRRLAELDEETRRRLVVAAGHLSRPDRYRRKALSKELIRKKKREDRDADRAALEATGIRALRRDPVFLTPPSQRPSAPLDPSELLDDGGEVDAWASAEADRWGGGEAMMDAAAEAPELEESTTPGPLPPRPRVRKARACYVCKNDFNELHFFYDSMCEACADLNWRKRSQTGDLRGRIALVTGARVKIGYQAAIKLVRAGAEVIITTRFPHDAARRLAAEADVDEWRDRVHVYGLDLRHTPSVEALCGHLLATLPRLDAIINNACQTVRRPSGFYDHLMTGETVGWAELPAGERAILERWEDLRTGARPALAEAASEGADGALVQALPRAGGHAGLWRSAVLSQLPLLSDDLERGNHLFPEHRLDADLQQVDLRDHNSWRMTLAEVSVAELLEVQLVNAVAPFVLNGRLRPLLARTGGRDAHVVNVSAMEGQFYRRFKTDKHPHTNMAKAALNMMTRTSAVEYVRDGIHMNAVDTGWVTDEDPAEIAARKQREHGFHPPLDIVDGAARIVDPVFDGLNTGNHRWGLFFKDYMPTDW